MTIKLRKATHPQLGKGWVCDFSGPGSEGILARWGTLTLPTAFRDTMPAGVVLARIRALNPGDTVEVAK